MTPAARDRLLAQLQEAVATIRALALSSLLCLLVWIAVVSQPAQMVVVK